MKIIVPMAGMGTRMRPHTLTIPKPLLPVAGKPIVQRLVEDIANVCDEAIEEVGFIIGSDFGQEVEDMLADIAGKLNATCKIYYQDDKLGTGHAIYCAEPSLNGKVVIAFADTLFKANFKLDESADGTIWVQRVEDPSAFGVVELNDENEIIGFVEKPQTFVSDLAIIGIYYFTHGEKLRDELKYIINNDLRENNEYQLTNALENLRTKGAKFVPGEVEEWLDCGNKEAIVNTNQRYLEYIKTENLISPEANTNNTVIIEPVFIGKDVEINNSVIGPHVSISKGTKINGSVIKNSIIQKFSTVDNALIENSMLGNHVKYRGNAGNLSIGDFNEVIA